MTAPVIEIKTQQRLRPFHWSEAFALPAKKYLIKGLLDEGALSVVYGESNCGKTFVTLDMAAHIARGESWQDCRTKQGSVVYVAAEGGFGFFKRLMAYQVHHCLTQPPPFYIVPTNVDMCSSSSDLEGLVKEINKLPNVSMVVVDTLSRALAGGDENSPAHMGAFVMNCDKLREATKSHVLIVHHSGKDQGRGARGHSCLKAAVDTEIEVTKMDGIITVEVKKQRDGATDRKFTLQLKQIDLGTDDEGDPITSCVVIEADPVLPKKKRLKGQKRRAYEILLNLMLDKGEPRIPKGGMPSVKTVKLADFRDALKKGNICSSDKPDAVTKAISRAIDGLNDDGITATYEDYIWIPGQAGQDRTDNH